VIKINLRVRLSELNVEEKSVKMPGVHGLLLNINIL